MYTTQQTILVEVVIVLVVSAHVLRKIQKGAQIFPQARNVPFTAKTASVISMVQTVSKPIKNQKEEKSQSLSETKEVSKML